MPKFHNQERVYTKGELLALLKGIPNDKLFWFTHNIGDYTESNIRDELYTLGQIKEALGLHSGNLEEDIPDGYAFTFTEAYLAESEGKIESLEQRIRELKKGLPLCNPSV